MCSGGQVDGVEGAQSHVRVTASQDGVGAFKNRTTQLEVISDPPEANILVNHISMARRGPAKLRLPPGLYSVALEREGFLLLGRTSNFINTDYLV